MGGSPSPGNCASLASALLLCSLFVPPSQAFGPGAYISRVSFLFRFAPWCVLVSVHGAGLS
jgi:hypothetical protein